MELPAWPPIAVMGAGAVGCYFGGMLARAGAPVTLIGRPAHVEAIRTRGLVLEISGTRHHVQATATAEADGVSRPAEVAALFARAAVPCEVSTDIEADLWTKLILNCGYNAISALSRARYGRIEAHPLASETLRCLVEEGVNVARAAGVNIPSRGLLDAAHKLGRAIPEALSSTAQDIARGKRTEIDALNGCVARRGAELGIPTPVNSTVHALVRLLEERETP